MAIEAAAPRPIIIGNDHTMELSGVVDENGVPVDMSTFAVTWFLRAQASSTDALLEVAGTVAGTYNIDPAINTQVMRATLTDDQTGALAQGVRHYAWKRMDGNNEVDLAYGPQVVLRTASR